MIIIDPKLPFFLRCVGSMNDIDLCDADGHRVARCCKDFARFILEACNAPRNTTTAGRQETTDAAGLSPD